MDTKALLSEFEKEYGGGGEIRIFFAPLRVNLIGEYTDIAGGRVLPCALDLGIYAAARKRGDSTLRLASADAGLRTSLDVSGQITNNPGEGWANYPKGVVSELLKRGAEIGGADIYYAATAAGFMSAGLSSSAAIEVLTGVVLNKLFSLGIDGVQMALLSQRAENQFVGVMCGIMDQFAVMMGKENNAILLDCASLDYKYIPASFGEKGLSLVIMNTNKKRGLLDSRYNERRAEADSALESLVNGGIIEKGAKLCSISAKVFEKNAHLIKDETVVLRARHLISENERVIEAAKALENSDFELFGKLLDASHISLKNDFDVTGKELDALQGAARSHKGCIGARMTGAGFGGCALALVKSSETEDFISRVSESYTEQTGLNATFHVCTPSEGAMEKE